MEYVSLKEAARLTGKAEITIRRLTKKPAAAGHFRYDQPDQRLMISPIFLRSHFPFNIEAPTEPEAPKSAPNTDSAEKISADQPDHSDYARLITPDQNDRAALITLLQEQNNDLKKDKEFLQGKLDEVSRQLSREQERTNFLLLQSSNEKPTGQQRPRLAYWLLLALVGLAAAAVFLLARP